MSKKRDWKGWRKLHLYNAGVWHYRVYPRMLDIREPGGKSHKTPMLVFDAFFRADNYRDSAVTPAKVKRFIEEVILTDAPAKPKFNVDSYVAAETPSQICFGQVRQIHAVYPRFVRVSWLRHEAPTTNYFWWDSHKLKPGAPSALHALGTMTGVE